MVVDDSEESVRDQQSWAEEQQGPQQRKGPFDGCSLLGTMRAGSTF